MPYGRMNMKISPAGNFGNVKKNMKAKINPMKKKKAKVPKFGFGKKGGY